MSGHAAGGGPASITATARAGVLNVITRWIARAAANNPLTGSPARLFRSVGISRKPRARRLVALATSVRSDIALAKVLSWPGAPPSVRRTLDRTGEGASEDQAGSVAAEATRVRAAAPAVAGRNVDGLGVRVCDLVRDLRPRLDAGAEAARRPA